MLGPRRLPRLARWLPGIAGGKALSRRRNLAGAAKQVAERAGLFPRAEHVSKVLGRVHLPSQSPERPPTPPPAPLFLPLHILFGGAGLLDGCTQSIDGYMLGIA